MPPQSSGISPDSELLIYPVWHGIRLVNLVDRDNDRHFRGVRVIDSLKRLRHYAVVRSDYENNDVSGFCSARTHSGKRLVTWRVKEYDLPPVSRRILIVNRDFVRADVLRDSTRFAAGNVGRANRVEQCSFP